MAMHKSDELAEAAAVLFQQLNELGAAPERMNIGIVKEDGKAIEFWSTEQGGKQIGHIFRGDINEPTTLAKAYHAWKEKKKSIVIDLSGDELSEWIRYLRDVVKMPVNEELVKGRRVHTAACFAQGMILMTTPQPLPDDTVNLLERFATVFNLTYRRFLDLQKAEAQAREAQIELALERVRARTMAMQKSDELAEAAQLLYHEFGTLGLDPFTCGYLFIKEEQNKQTAWVTLPDGTLIPDFIDFPLTGDPILDNRYKSWKQKEALHRIELQGEENKEHHRFLASKVPAQVANEIFAQIPERIFVYCANFSAGYLFIIATKLFSSEAEQTIIRFAKVFEMTYTRFLDLKQAEAQAREAQIEAGLERVRSRAMAMHKTDELLDAAELVYKELTALGITSMSINYAFVDDEEKNGHYYSTNPVDGKIPPFPFVFPHTETDVMRSILSGWKKQEPFNVIELDEDATLKHQTYIGEICQRVMETHNMPFSIEAFLAISPKKAVIYTFNFSKGYLFIIGGARLTTMQEEMVLRFTKVFEMTYRRFLDLKLAEAQAREATI